MGLFGSSPDKKLQKARELLDAGQHFDARRAFQEVLRRREKLTTDAAAAAEAGERQSREGMIRARLSEAQALERAGEIASARDRIQVALDLAGQDLDRRELEELLHRLSAVKRAPAVSGAEELPGDLLGERPGREEPSAPRPEPSEEDLFGASPEETFALYMETLEPDLAGLYRAQPDAFQRAYVALTQGAPQTALRYFEQLGDARALPEPVRLERARALLLARRSEEALELLESFPAPDAAVRWTRVEALRELGRRDDAVQAAAELVDSLPGHGEASDALYAWTLIDAGRPDEAWHHLEGWIQSGTVSEDVLVAAAQAASQVGRGPEARALLEGLIQHRLHVSLQTGREPNFPVEAGRKLLQLLLEAPSGRAEREGIRALTLHLLDYDPERAEAYREILLRY